MVRDVSLMRPQRDFQSAWHMSGGARLLVKSCFFLGVVAAALAAGGCVSVPGTRFSGGTQISTNAVDQIVRGRTTLAELEALLGPPAYVSMTRDGRRVLVYVYSDTALQPTTYVPFVSSLKVDSRRQMLEVVLSDSNIVDDYNFRDQTARARAGGMFGSGLSTTETTAPVR
jgi:hypothetical protein